jgi:hypothetical protein
MIWLTWRQFRAQAAMVYGGVTVLGLLLAVTGPQLVRLRQTAGPHFLDDISGSDRTLYIVATLAVLALPALIGLFWGAPLITRELDAGTQKLAWTQTTRARWLATKLLVIGLAAIAAAALLSLAVTWWASPVDAAIASVNGLPAPGLLVFARISREIFDARGLVPAGYSAFAFVLGVTIGVLVRRTLAAMALFLAAFAVSQIFMSVAVRPELARHDELTTTITAANMQSLNIANTITIVVSEPGAWITAQQTLNASGHPAKAPPKSSTA